MPTTLLDLVKSASRRLHLEEPTEIVAATDPQTKQLLSIVYDTGEELFEADYDWPALSRQVTFTTLATEAQTDALPSDWARFPRNTDIWNATRQMQMTGPVNAAEWSEALARAITVWPQYWRILEGVLHIYPATAGESLRFEVISNLWIKDETNVSKAAFTVDTDTVVFPDRLMRLGIRWRWKQAKGLDYAEDLEDFGRAKEAAMTASTGTRRITVDRGPQPSWDGTTWPGFIQV